RQSAHSSGADDRRSDDGRVQVRLRRLLFHPRHRPPSVPAPQRQLPRNTRVSGREPEGEPLPALERERLGDHFVRVTRIPRIPGRMGRRRAMFRYLLFAIAAIAAAVVATAEETHDTLPARVAVLPAEMGPALLHQCSRGVPAADDFWTPSPEDVLAAEKGLPHFMAHAKCHAPIHPVDEYIRQY